jgi:hypothetical protein
VGARIDWLKARTFRRSERAGDTLAMVVVDILLQMVEHEQVRVAGLDNRQREADHSEIAVFFSVSGGVLWD